MRETFRASYLRVRIEDVLQDVDELCGFTRAFHPLGGILDNGSMLPN